MPHINLSTPEVLALQDGATEFVRPVKNFVPMRNTYGQPGDVLACRETWGIDSYGGTMDGDGYGEWRYRLYYKAGGEKTVVFAGKCEEDPYAKHYDSQRGMFNSPATMPLKFVRYRVVIASVRAAGTSPNMVWKITHGGIKS